MGYISNLFQPITRIVRVVIHNRRFIDRVCVWILYCILYNIHTHTPAHEHAHAHKHTRILCVVVQYDTMRIDVVVYRSNTRQHTVYVCVWILYNTIQCSHTHTIYESMLMNDNTHYTYDRLKEIGNKINRLNVFNVCLNTFRSNWIHNKWTSRIYDDRQLTRKS